MNRDSLLLAVLISLVLWAMLGLAFAIGYGVGRLSTPSCVELGAES